MRWLGVVLVLAIASPAAADDQQIAALATKAARCKYGMVGFDPQCAAWLAWNSEHALFAKGQGTALLLGWLGSKDPKFRRLAAEKLHHLSPRPLVGSRDVPAPLDDPKVAARVIQVAAAEREGAVAYQLGTLVAAIDVARVGLVAEQLALAASHPDEHLRANLAEAIRVFPGPASGALISKLLEDPKRHVRWSALEAIGREPLGKHLVHVCPGVARMAKAERADAQFVEQLVKTGCAEMLDLGPAWVSRRGADPKHWDDDRARLGTILAVVCELGSETQATAAYKVALELIEPKKHSYIRSGGVQALAGCRDVPGAAERLQKLTGDADRSVAEDAARLAKPRR